MTRARWLRPRHFGTEADLATFQTLHTASLMTEALRDGLNAASADTSVRLLRSLIGAPAVGITDTTDLLSWEGQLTRHRRRAPELARIGVTDGGTLVRDHRDFDCGDAHCPIRHIIVAPLTVEERVVGTLQAYVIRASALLVRTSTELAAWVSGQLELAELDASRSRLMEAEVRSLRAQISPHFVYNSLTAIASFVRTDPDRARDLLLDFADFSRYSLRRLGDYTTLEEELRCIERYLVLEQARFGERLGVTLRIAPEVLPISIPALSIQPLVENAVRHGLAPRSEGGSVTILAEDRDRDARISIEDDGVGEDPERIRRILAGDRSIDSIGLFNVDERLRATFGDEYGLVVETAPGAGTKVTIRVPKYTTGIRP